MKKTIKCISVVLLVGISLLFAQPTTSKGPLIEVDSVKVNLGKIKKEEVKLLKHVFIVRNSGDEPLKITRVKPG